MDLDLHSPFTSTHCRSSVQSYRTRPGRCLTHQSCPMSSDQRSAEIQQLELSNLLGFAKCSPVCNLGGVSNGWDIYTNERLMIGKPIQFGCLDSDQIPNIDFSFWRTQRISNAKMERFYGVLAEIGTLGRLRHYPCSGYT